MDTIYRQAAIDVLKKISFKYWFEEGEYVGECSRELRIINADKAVKEIERLPSAQHERKKGKWVECDGDWLKTMCKCSECGAMIDINEKYRNFFCYHCGAIMDGGQAKTRHFLHILGKKGRMR